MSVAELVVREDWAASSKAFVASVAVVCPQPVDSEGGSAVNATNEQAGADDSDEEVDDGHTDCCLHRQQRLPREIGYGPSCNLALPFNPNSDCADVFEPPKPSVSLCR